MRVPQAAAGPEAEAEATAGSKFEACTVAGLAKSVCERDEEAEAR